MNKMAMVAVVLMTGMVSTAMAEDMTSISVEKAGSGNGGRLMERRKSGSGEAGGMEERSEGLLARVIENPKLGKELGLTDEQVATFRLAFEDMKKKESDLQAQQEKLGLDQARLLTEKTLDEAALMTAIEKSGQIRIEMAKLRIKHLLLVRKTLTPEQIEKSKEMIRQRMKEGRKEGGLAGDEGKKRRDRWAEWKTKRGTNSPPEGSSEKAVVE